MTEARRREAIVKMATDPSFGERLRNEPDALAREFDLDAGDLALLESLQDDAADNEVPVLRPRLSKSSLFFGGHLHGETAHASAGVLKCNAHVTVEPTIGHDGSTSYTDGTTSDMGGVVVDHTEYGELSIPPNPYALCSIAPDGHVVAATWDDAGGHHSAVLDPHGGNTWTDTAVAPDGSHVVTTISFGGRDQYYTSEQVITGPDGQITDVSFDTWGHVTSYTGSGPTSWTDSSGHHTLTRDADGMTTTTNTAADGSSSVIVSTGGHAVSQTNYDSSGHQTTTQSFNPDGSNAHGTGSVTSADGSSTTTYHSDGSYTLTRTDGTSVSYNSFGEITGYTEHAEISIPPNAYALCDVGADGHLISATWTDAAGQHTATPDPHGGTSWTDVTVAPDGTQTVTTIQIDGMDRYYNAQEVITSPDGQITEISYDTFGHLVSVSSSGTFTWTDSTGQHTLVHHADGSLSTTNIAPDGSRSVVVSEQGHAVSQTNFDAAGHQTTTQQFRPDGSNAGATGTVTGDAGTTTYNADGTYTVTHPDGTTTSYSSYGTVTGSTEYAGLVIPPHSQALFDVDGNGHIRSATWDDAEGHHTAMPDPHGGNGWTDTAVAADGTRTVNEISFSGSDQYYTAETSVTSPDGTWTDTTFDADGNVLAVTHGDASDSPPSSMPPAASGSSSSGAVAGVLKCDGHATVNPAALHAGEAGLVKCNAHTTNPAALQVAEAGLLKCNGHAANPAALHAAEAGVLKCDAHAPLAHATASLSMHPTVGPKATSLLNEATADNETSAEANQGLPPSTDIGSLADVVLMNATNDQDKDLELIMSDVSGQTDAQHSLREVMANVSADIAADVAAQPGSASTPHVPPGS